MLSPPKKQLPLGLSALTDYKNFQHVGRGATCEVYVADHKKYKKVCIKVIESRCLKNYLDAKLIENQVKILQRMEHENILHFIQQVKIGGKMMIVTRYYEGGDLEHLLMKKKKLDLEMALQYFLGVVQACLYLQLQNILHRDIKPANIFYDKNTVVLADFGFATYESDSDLMNLNVGSPCYMAPEALSQNKFSRKSQVFALGTTLHEMLTGRTPWEASSQKQLLIKMKKPLHLQLRCSKSLQQMVLHCLSYEPEKRPSLEKIKQVVIGQLKMLQNMRRNNFLSYLPKIIQDSIQKKTRKWSKKREKQNSKSSECMIPAHEIKQVNAQNNRRDVRPNLKQLNGNQITQEIQNIKRVFHTNQGKPDHQVGYHNFRFLPFLITYRYYRSFGQYYFVGPPQFLHISPKITYLSLEIERISQISILNKEDQACLYIERFILSIYQRSKCYELYHASKTFLLQLNAIFPPKIKMIL